MSVASTTELRADRDGGGAQSTMDLDSNRGAATSLSHLIPTSHSLDREECSVPSELTHRPPNVPATRNSGTPCAVCVACTLILAESFCNY